MKQAPVGLRPLVKEILAGRSTQAAALSLVSGTKLTDLYVRHALADGGTPAIDASTDPLILLVKLIDLDARAMQQQPVSLRKPERAGETHARLYCRRTAPIDVEPGGACADFAADAVSTHCEGNPGARDCEPIVVRLKA